MTGRINHIGIATPSIADSLVIRDLFGFTDVVHIGPLPEQGVTVTFVNVPGGVQLELIEPYGDNSPITAFLAKSPKGGQHHVCFEVPDIVAARDDMRAKGATVLGTGEPRMGAHGVPVIFVHPKNTGGVLVELMQAPGAGH